MIKKHNRSFNVCWDITSKCNECCLFCYRNLEDCDLPLNENFLIFKNLVNNGAVKISFTGGEALLYRPLFELAKMGKDYCSRVSLSLTTNGLLLAKWDEEKQNFVPNKEYIEKIAEYFDW
ncbi:MAG TPA: radical SAM protein, partial [Bacteroidales bacterium]|nr:radical SAM protein [Bacteroidales bacterium]